MATSQIGSTPPPGSACGQHPERAAVGICSRCGNYACQECFSGQLGQCAECQRRNPVGSFPLTRDNWSLEGVFGHAWRTLNNDRWPILWGAWALAMPYVALVLAPTFVMVGQVMSGGAAPEDLNSPRFRVIASATYLVGMVVGSPLLLGLFAFMAARVQGRILGPVRAVREQLGRVGPFVVLLALTMPIVYAIGSLAPAPAQPGVGSLQEIAFTTLVAILVNLAVAPVVTIQYMAMVELVLDHGASAPQALKTTLRNVAHRPLLALSTTLVIGIMLGLSLACCLLPGIYFMPFSLLAFATLCLAIRAH